MMGVQDPDPSRWGVRALHRSVQRLTAAISELARIPRLTARLVFGASEERRQADGVHAAAVPASVPGVIHYDVLRDDPRMHELLHGLLERHDLLRLCDGGVVDNVPVRNAWPPDQRTGPPRAAPLPRSPGTARTHTSTRPSARPFPLWRFCPANAPSIPSSAPPRKSSS